ncbi:flagellar biosynthesis protein FlhB [Luteithermobacter gelatinilyticus]|uniref:flagellar biosynthesis protein FlhB n=1 Tax=Luteithermobacter gelatinilyticus TaxID=2582913 RepID=UPI0011057936|nr:flagellar biosynthesis protein FlhB [Luteithermobacter gelatinilyticus]
MAEDQDQSQKTEEPTQKRLQDALEKGEVAKSQEVRHFFILLAATLIILVSASGAMRGIGNLLARVFEYSYAVPMDGPGLETYVAGLFLDVAAFMVLPVILLIMGALAGAMVQHRPMISVEKIKPKLSKISPLAGVKRLFSMQNVVEFLKSLLKIIIVACVVLLLVWPERDQLEVMMTYEISEAVDIVFLMVLRILGGVVAIMALIAGFDYLFQRFQFLKQLRMTKQEVKDELKQTEGDPMVRARLRQIRMERARNRMMSAVPEADVVVTNPTHYAVAMQYKHGEMDVPKVVAKGMDHIALKIREIAEEHEIPVLENPPLARSLYAVVEVDEEIHPEHYKAVAEVISYLLRLKKGERVTYRPTAAVTEEG